MEKAERIVKIELPEDSRYRLTKKESVNGIQTFVIEGQFVEGILHTNPMEIGGNCFVLGKSIYESISTSIIKRINIDPKNSKLVILETMNSIYELEELD